MTSAKKKAITSVVRVRRQPTPRSNTNIDELKARLNLFLAPDFTNGDFWPRLYRRLYGLLPDLIAQTLDVLDAKYPADKPTANTCCKHHERAD